MENGINVNKNTTLKYIKNIQYNELKKYINGMFINLCIYNKLKIMKYLIKLFEENNNKINIRYAFSEACTHNHLEIFKYLILLGEESYGKINTRVDENIAFRHAGEVNNVDMAEYLKSLEHAYGKIKIW